MDLDALINEAKDKIGALIQKPKMNEKLLSKPPFRFLHDTIVAIISTTGFAQGLYTDEELDSANVNEKQQKINFLDKIIRTVGLCLGKEIDVRPLKIVAGAEPENTNIFLIALADAIANPNVDREAAVRRCLAGEQPSNLKAVIL